MLNRYSITHVTPVHQLPLLDTLMVTWKDKTLLVFIIGGILINVGYSQIDSNLPQYIQQSFSDGVALFASSLHLNAILVIILQVPLSLISEKWPVLRVMIFGSIFFAVGFASFGFATTAIGMMIAMAIVTIGEIFIFPSTSVFIDQIAPEESKRNLLWGWPVSVNRKFHRTCTWGMVASRLRRGYLVFCNRRHYFVQHFLLLLGECAHT